MEFETVILRFRDLVTENNVTIARHKDMIDKKGFGVNAISGRIKDDHIRFLRHIIQNLQHIPGNKTTVIDAVKCSVFSGGFYRVFHDLHADHLAGNGRRKLGNGAGSAVKIKHYLISGSCGNYHPGRV